MASLETRIEQAASKNKELLVILGETDHAEKELAQQGRLIADLEGEVAKSDKRVKAADDKRKIEFKDHEKYRDSVLRRFAYKATGNREKFAAKALKEENEYFEALQDEHREKELNQSLRDQLKAARDVAANLEREVARHKSAQEELDQLYNKIFGGVTPSMPEEDKQEGVMREIGEAYNKILEQAKSEWMAVQLLMDAKKRMDAAAGSMQDALSASRMDMFSSGSFADMMERNALHHADVEVSAARSLVAQAQRMSPRVGQMPDATINQGHLMRDVFFDNIFTDMSFHEEIHASNRRVLSARQAVIGIAEDARERHRKLDLELKEKQKELQDARVVLQKIRESAFESVAGKK